MTYPSSGRPLLADITDADEFARWYWLKRELQEFARANQIPSSGSKADLTRRISACLSGDRESARARASRPAAPRLTGDLTPDTVLASGQRISRDVRDFLVAHCPGFVSDSHMRAFFKDCGGKTLQQAVDHWFATRGLPKPEIGEQFEFNRFVRQWHLDHPDGTREQALADWYRYSGRAELAT